MPSIGYLRVNASAETLGQLSAAGAGGQLRLVGCLHCEGVATV